MFDGNVCRIGLAVLRSFPSPRSPTPPVQDSPGRLALKLPRPCFCQARPQHRIFTPAEEIPMKIGIIGTGNIGGNLTRSLRKLGHEVAIANSRGPETLSGLAAETGAIPVTVKEAAKGRDLVVITIPEAHIKD